MRKVTARVLTLALLVVAALAIPGVARADTVTWNGTNGAENLPCPNGAHWVLAGSGADAISNVTLNTTNPTESVPMEESGNKGSWSADTSGNTTASTTAEATFTGSADNLTLTLSHCLAEATTTTTTTTLGNAPGTPNTGFNPLPFVAIGLLLLTGGALLLRRKTA